MVVFFVGRNMGLVFLVFVVLRHDVLTCLLLRGLFLCVFQFGVVHQVVYIGTLRHGNLSLSRLGFLQVVEECLCLGAGGEAYREY